MFKDALKALREEFDLSQQAFANELNNSQSTVGNWESGVREPNFETVGRIANYFDVPLDYLLSRGVFENWDEILDIWEEIAKYLDKISKCLSKPHVFEYENIIKLDLIKKIRFTYAMFDKIKINEESHEIRLYFTGREKIDSDLKTDTLTISEQEHIEKYRYLDIHGRETVDFILNREYLQKQNLDKERHEKELKRELDLGERIVKKCEPETTAFKIAARNSTNEVQMNQAEKEAMAKAAEVAKSDGSDNTI